MDDTSDSELLLVESSMPVHVRYSLATPMIEDGIKHKTIVTSVITFSKPSKSPRTVYQIHISHEEKKPAHLLESDFSLKRVRR